MATIRINDAEWELFAGEPAELLKLYCVLKRRMDRETCIAGLETLINDIVLREGFTVDPLPGRKKPKPVTRQKWRSAISRMEKMGVLKVIGPNVFQFPYAIGISSSKTAATKQQPQQQPHEQPTEPTLQPLYSVALSILEDLSPTTATPQENASSNLLLLKTSSSTSCAQDPAPPERSWMRPDWTPDPDTWSELLEVSGLASEEFTGLRLQDFRSHWIARHDKRRSEGEWQQKLIQSLQRNVQHAKAAPAARAPKKPHLRAVPTRPKSAEGNRSTCNAARQAQEFTEAAVAEQCKAQGISGDRETLRELLRSRLNRGKKP